MSLPIALLLLAATAQPTKERLADLFWDSCVDQKPFAAHMQAGDWKDVPHEMRKRFEGASLVEVRKATGAGGIKQALVIRATFVPAKNHIVRRCALVSNQWSAIDADELVNLRAEKRPYSEVQPMMMPRIPVGSAWYHSGELNTYQLGWSIAFQQDHRRGRAEYVRYTNLKAQELLAKERAMQAEYEKSKKARRK